jgi:DNA-binding transcriptional LysR family regulator
MTLDQLRTFLAVLEHESFTRAAQVLGIGQSTVSFHIAALERSVGAALLDRRGGRARPTAAGRLLRRYAARMLSLRDEAIGRLRAEENGETGRVAIAASTIPGEYLLPEMLASFRRSHPRVSLSVEVSDSRRAISALLAEDCDLAMIGTRPADPRIVSSPFASDEIVLIGPSPNPFAPGLRLTRAELEKVAIIMREDGSGTRQTVTAALRRSVRPGGEHPAPILVGSSEAAKRCARHGLGLAFVSRRAADEDVAAGRITIVEVPGLPVRRRFYVARLRRATLPAAARAFLQLVLQEHR